MGILAFEYDDDLLFLLNPVNVREMKLKLKKKKINPKKKSYTSCKKGNVVWNLLQQESGGK